MRGLWGEEPFWQRNYYERIIRESDELARAREYVRKNPAAWQYDAENPARAQNETHELSWGWLESG
jgi:hypothetical protein